MILKILKFIWLVVCDIASKIDPIGFIFAVYLILSYFASKALLSKEWGNADFFEKVFVYGLILIALIFFSMVFVMIICLLHEVFQYFKNIWDKME